ncbi:TolC family protein [Rhodanobacter sp. FW102-FHT14D06]|uniref:TolC family protein n=2 Tax=unclassified Rhodanobacter TaxID=2621553 RepID=A0AB74UZL8_9GAMM
MPRRHRSLLLGGSIAVLLAGCASYQARPLSPATQAAALDQRTLDAPRLRHFLAASVPATTAAHPTGAWDLTALTFAALYYQPDLDLARAKLATARAGITTAKQRPNPTLDFSLNYDASSPIAVPFTVGPVVNFIIETFGKRGYRTAQAQHALAAARWDLATTGWQVRSHVRTALLDLWAARQRLQLACRRLTLQQQLVSLIDKRLAVGEASSLDSTREHINRAQLDLAVQDLERAMGEARVQLATAIGVPVQALDGVSLSFQAFEQPPSSAQTPASGALRERALTQRTDVQASLADYEASQSALQLQIAHQYPNLTLGPGYNYDLGDNRYLLGFGGELPIFNQNQGPIADAVARRAQAAATFEALQARIIGAIDQGTVAYRGTMQSLAHADALLADARRRRQQIESAFQAGQADRPTLVTAELELASIEASRFDALVAQRQALAALEDALQQPLFDPGLWPKIPEQNPRTITDTEPSS